MDKSEFISYNQSLLTDNSNSMIIPNGVLNMNDIISFNITNNGVLKRIVIGESCYRRVREFELDGLNELESVEIRGSSYGIIDNVQSDGLYRVVNCPKLKSIRIGYRSFLDYHSFELNNLPSLQSIDIGNECFRWAPSFSLTGLIDGLV